jgi:hypothetical protein
MLLRREIPFVETPRLSMGQSQNSEKQNIDLVLKVRENLIENKKTTRKGQDSERCLQEENKNKVVLC